MIDVSVIDTRKVYATVVDKHHHLVRKDGGEYSDEHFFAHPEEYKATFPEKVLISKLLCDRILIASISIKFLKTASLLTCIHF